MSGVVFMFSTIAIGAFAFLVFISTYVSETSFALLSGLVLTALFTFCGTIVGGGKWMK